MAMDPLFQISDILLHTAVIGKDIIRAIKHALITFTKPGENREQATLWILLPKVWYRIYKSQIL